jgi:DNA primase
VRRYYKQDMDQRVRALFSPVTQFPRDRNAGGFGGASRRGPVGDWKRGMRNREPLGAPSPRLGQSPMVRGFKSAIPPREALILLAVIRHPFLLETHAEEFAELEFLHPDADQLRKAVLEAGSHEAHPDTEELQAELTRRGLGPLLGRVAAAITHASDWPAQADAAEADVAQWWGHVVTLHRKKRTLNRELKDAERALGEDPSEANLAWLRDVQSRLAALEGTEALIEGFGASSGRLSFRGV